MMKMSPRRLKNVSTYWILEAKEVWVQTRHTTKLNIEQTTKQQTSQAELVLLKFGLELEQTWFKPWTKLPVWFRFSPSAEPKPQVWFAVSVFLELQNHGSNCWNCKLSGISCFEFNRAQVATFRPMTCGKLFGCGLCSQTLPAHSFHPSTINHRGVFPPSLALHG